MALQFSTTLRNDMLNSGTAITNVWNTVLGSAATLDIYTGSAPANCGTANSGTLLASVALDSAAFGTASSGAIIMGGLTLSATAGNSGTAGYFRIHDGSNVCHVQGTCGAGSGDLSFNSTTITSGQSVQITGFTVTAPGA